MTVASLICCFAFEEVLNSFKCIHNRLLSSEHLVLHSKNKTLERRSHKNSVLFGSAAAAPSVRSLLFSHLPAAASEPPHRRHDYTFMQISKHIAVIVFIFGAAIYRLINCSVFELPPHFFS